MSTRIFNLSATSPPIPGPSFYWARDKDGKCTGRHTFTILRGALMSAESQSRFSRGRAITTLDTTLPAAYSFLTISDIEAQDLPGGFEEVTVNLSGYTEGEEFETDRETTYSSNNSLVEESILKNPNFLSEVSSVQTRESFTKMMNGLATGSGSYSGGGLSSVAIYDSVRDSLIETITDADALAWYKLIFTEDHRTYLRPAYEWTKSTANLGGLSNAELANLGKIDSPPGDQPEPPDDGFVWLKMGASDVRGEGSATTEETWQWGKWPSRIYSD